MLCAKPEDTNITDFPPSGPADNWNDKSNCTTVRPVAGKARESERLHWNDPWHGQERGMSFRLRCKSGYW